MISKFFIDRPVFASVVSIIIVLAGLMALRILPIAQYPQIIPPEVSVNASYPGASAQVISETVAAPLEQQINGVERMLYMRSTSTGSGTLSLSVTFDIGTNPDQNTINVNNRVQRAIALLSENGIAFIDDAPLTYHPHQPELLFNPWDPETQPDQQLVIKPDGSLAHTSDSQSDYGNLLREEWSSLWARVMAGGAD